MSVRKPVLPVADYKPIYVGDTYTTKRKGSHATITVYVAGVKKDKVKLKRDQFSVDSFTESRAKMDQYYVRQEDAKTRCHDECVQRIIGFATASLEIRNAIVEHRMKYNAQFDEFVKSTPSCDVNHVVTEFALRTTLDPESATAPTSPTKVIRNEPTLS
jgi:hypothetical protein